MVTALPEASVALRVTVAVETYHPFNPTVPPTLIVETGPCGGPPIAMRVVFVASALPALSVELSSNWWVPLPLTVTGTVYVVHGPRSTRYFVDATPLVASVAASVTFTGPMYHVELPFVPWRLAVVLGATVSILNWDVCMASTFPARSVELSSKLWELWPLTVTGLE